MLGGHDGVFVNQATSLTEDRKLHTLTIGFGESLPVGAFMNATFRN